MAYRYKSRRRTYRRRPTRKYRSRFTRKLARSLTQKDTCRLIITMKPLTKTLDFITLDSNQGYLGACTKIVTINPMYTLVGYQWGSGVNDKVAGLAGFKNFTNLFDQFKINAIRVKIQIVSQPMSAGSNAIIVRSAIDRNGISSELNTKINTADTAAAGDPLKAAIVAENQIFETYSSFNTKVINVTDLYSLYRTFYPVGKERGTWYGSSFHFEPSSATTTNLSEFMYPFKPIIMLQFATNAVASATGTTEVFNISIDYDITFKGQRNINTN